jgi:signal transduction histidine kinase
MIRDILRRVYPIAVTLTALTLCVVIAFFLTSFIFAKLDLKLSLLPLQIINFLLGLILALLFSYLIRSKLSAPHVSFFDSIIRATEQIARGDFNVRVNYNMRDDQPFGELAKSVNNMASELSQMEMMRQEFISNVSHEIQSPLTSIGGFAQALRDEQLSPEERLHYLSIIETESHRLSKLSDNLLRLASLEARNMKFEPRSYRLDKQLRNLILACEPQWRDKQIDIQVFLDEIDIKADEDLLGQVWINLIHNSIKFTSEGGRVCLDLHRQGDDIEVKISDSGIGIGEEDQTHIFERFYKADRSRERSRGGSGLGLSISKKIIEMHQGTIAVQSILGAGTTFTISLPAE